MRAARGDDRPSSALDLPPEVQAQVVHAMLDKHYRALLDEPIAMLGDLSPRAASRSAKGREKIAVWLKHQAYGEPIPPCRRSQCPQARFPVW